MNIEFCVIAIFMIVALQTSPWKILWVFCSNCVASIVGYVMVSEYLTVNVA